MSLKILNKKRIQKVIENLTVDFFNKAINKKKNAATKELKNAVYSWVFNSPEMKSLRDNGIPFSLNSLFGIPEGSAESACDAIARSVVDSLEIDFSGLNKKSIGSIQYKFQTQTFSNLIGLSSGTVSTEKGTSLDWLDWLLFEGDSTIIVGYSYIPKQGGRSGLGQMSSGGFFRVPPQYSGTIRDNFVTRALSGRDREIESILSRVFK